MSLSDCPKCWNTPCTCGYEYSGYSLEQLQSFIGGVLQYHPIETRQQVLSDLLSQCYTQNEEKTIVVCKTTVNDARTAFLIIQERYRWLRDNGLQQWSKNYLRRYDVKYFRLKAIEGNLYIAKNDDEIVGCVVVNDNDDAYWSDVDQTTSLFPKNFATKIGFPGVGKLIDDFLVELARKNGKQFLYMDCDGSNVKLRSRHEANGWCLQECVDDPDDTRFCDALYQKEV